MNNTTTNRNLDLAFQRYASALELVGIPAENLQLIHGSKTQGNSFKVVFVDPESRGHIPAPGTDFGGFIGWTKREAHEALDFMSRVIRDIKYFEVKS